MNLSFKCRENNILFFEKKNFLQYLVLKLKEIVKITSINFIYSRINFASKLLCHFATSSLYLQSKISLNKDN